MKTQLQETVLAALRDDDEVVRAMLPAFSVRDWQRCYGWLDASGLALHLLQRLERLGVAECLPVQVRARLMQNREDLRARTMDQVCEFARVQRVFDKTSRRFAVLKGFSLIPDYCPDPSLRYQFDFDYLVARRDAHGFADALASLGYELTHSDATEWHFEKNNHEVPSTESLYKPRPQRAVELHFGLGHSMPADASDDELLSRARRREFKGIGFWSLAPADMFIMQSLHLYRHITGEWTRISWLLEHRNFVLTNRDNHLLWEEARQRAVKFEDGSLAIGISILLASMAFGEFAPIDLTDCTVQEMPKSVRRWVEHYGPKLLFAEFPGTKLYLLLQRELLSRERWTQLSRARLFPLHLPVPVTQTRLKRDSHRLRALWPQISFFLFRLRFHLREAVRFWVEWPRWKKIRTSLMEAGERDRATKSTVLAKTG